MKINTINFLKSAPNKKFWPKDSKKEICIIGKSNVGKSTFINKLSNNNKISKVSNTPGLTKMLNFFDINDNSFRIVDTPGYGYSKVSKKDDNQFLNMMEEYVFKRENTILYILLIDIRRSISNDDLQIIDVLNNINKPVLVIGTKKDKTNQSQRHKFINETKKNLKHDKLFLIHKDDKIEFTKILKEIQKYIKTN